MENYPSNSNKSKAEQAENEKKVEQIVSAKSTKKKSGFGRFVDNFVTTDIMDVKSYIFTEVMIPAIKSTISDIVSNGIDMLMYGESRGRRSSGSGAYVNYNKMSYNASYKDNRSKQKPAQRQMHSADEIILETRGEADEVLGHLIDIIEEYGMASIADLYDLVGLQTSYTDNKYGWYDLANAHVARVREGFVLKLPRAEALV